MSPTLEDCFIIQDGIAYKIFWSPFPLSPIIIFVNLTVGTMVRRVYISLFAGTWVGTQVFMLEKQMLYHFSYTSSQFFCAYFVL
jgi:hypothetical protein